MNERLKMLRKELRMSQDVFAEKIGLTKNYISLVENGNRNLSEQSFKVLCSMFHVNEEWLRTGEGEMFKPKTKDEQIAELLGDIQSTGEENFKHKLVSALAKLNDGDWDTLEKLVDSIADK